MLARQFLEIAPLNNRVTQREFVNVAHVITVQQNHAGTWVALLTDGKCVALKEPPEGGSGSDGH